MSVCLVKITINSSSSSNHMIKAMISKLGTKKLKDIPFQRWWIIDREYRMQMTMRTHPVRMTTNVRLKMSQYSSKTSKLKTQESEHRLILNPFPCKSTNKSTKATSVSKTLYSRRRNHTIPTKMSSAVATWLTLCHINPWVKHQTMTTKCLITVKLGSLLRS